MIVHVDKEDFVISVEHENRSNGQMPAVETQQCTGSWHTHGTGKRRRYEEVPISEFLTDKRGVRFKTCNSCRAKQHQYQAKRNAIQNENNPNIVSTPVLASTVDAGLMHKWLVTIIKRTTVTVYAKDYLDAGVEAGEGEVTNVERLD